MSSLASINVKFSADILGFSKEMQNVMRELDKAGKKFKEIGTSMSTYITAPILAAGAASIKFASDYNESLNKVDVSFKNSSASVKDFAKTSLESFGIAEGTALDLASSYGDMGTSLGLSTEKAASMSTSLVGLAGDLASFKNISIDIANTALTGVFTGETESLKKLGIVMTEGNLQNYAYSQGMKTKVADMDQATKVNLRYAYILSVTTNAQGDFTRTGAGAANQMRVFQESLKQLAAQFGAVILPLFTRMITAINEHIKAFGKLSQETRTVIVVVAGLVAVIGPLLLAIGAVLTVIPFIVTGFALISGAILPILAGMTLLWAAFEIYKSATASVVTASVQLTDSQKLIQKVTAEATGSIVDQKTKLDLLLITARNENESKANRLKAIQDINKISPEYLGNLSLENINTDKARVSLEKYNTALIAGATARAASRLLEQNQVDKIKAGFEREKALADYNAKRETAISKGWEAEKSFYEENNRLMEFANDALDRKNTKYDNEAKLLTEIYNKNKQNLDLANGIETPTAVVDPTGKVKPVKREDINSIGSVSAVESTAGTVGSYDAKIAELENFKTQIATTAGQIKLADDEIAQINFAKSLKFNPQDVITISGGFAKLQTQIAAKAGGIKASMESIKSEGMALKQTIADAMVPALTNAFDSLGQGIVSGLGLAKNGFEGFVGVMIQTITKLIAMMLSASISQSIAGATASGVATGPASIFTTPAFIATAVGGVVAAFAAIPKFETGGIVGGSSFYGDKIMARVNSGELILNQKQQQNLHGLITPNGGGTNVTLGGSFVIDGHKLRMVLDRTDARKNRIG